MWRCFVLIVLVGQFWTIQTALVQQPENVRVARQLGITECCPCDPTERRSYSDQDKAAASNPDVRMGVLDDCPCRGRSADADGASSILFPNAVRALRPLLKSDEAKKDLKPLLHPEVDLASSVLSTLKEVTEEDYQEALARDAARNAAKVLERDAQPKESDNNLVTIVLDPNSDSDVGDFVAQESHNQESRCVDPLRSERYNSEPLHQTPSLLDSLWSPSNMKTTFKPGFLDDRNINDKKQDLENKIRSLKSNSIFNNVLDKIRRPNVISHSDKNASDDCLKSRSIDSAVSPSNIEEHFAENQKSDLGEIISRPIKNLLKLRDVQLIPRNVFGENKLAKPQEVIPPFDLEGLKERINQLKLPNLIENIKRREPIQKIKPKHSNFKDNGLAASDVQEQLIKMPIVKPLNLKNPKTLFTNLESFPADTNKIISNVSRFTPITNIAKFNNSLHERFSRIPNLLEELRNQKNSLKDSDVSASNIDRQQIETVKSDISTKLNALREKTKNMLSEKGILPNLVKRSQTQKNKPVKIDSILNQNIKSAENREPDIPKDETPTIKESPDQSNMLDVVPSPSEKSATLIKMENQNANTFSKSVDSKAPNLLVFKSLGDSINSHKIAVPLQSTDEETTKENTQSNNCSLDDDSTEIKETNVSMIPEDIPETLSSEIFPISNRANEIKQIEDTARGTNERFDGRSNSELEKDSNEDQELIGSESEDSYLKEDLKAESSDDTKDDFNITEDLSDSSTNQHPVTMDDLQEMSDSLLDEENQQKSFESFKEQMEPDNSKIVSTCEELKSESESNPENIHIKPITGDILTSDSEERDFKQFTTESEPISLNNLEADEVDEDKQTCTSDLALEKQTPKDSISEASELIPNTLKSPLLSLNRIVEPTSLNSLNNLINAPRHQIGDILNLNKKIPTLDEIHSKVANALHPLSILSVANTPNTIERDIDLIPDPSERKFKSISPEPLEIDVFQMNPLSSSRTPSSRNLARLNLDTLRTQLAMPKSVGIKPLRLESAVGDKRGMVGTSFLFGSDKHDLLKAESTSLIDRIRNSNSLKSPIGDLPSLEELGNRMRERFSSIFETDTIPTNLGSKSIQSLSDSLRSRAEDGVKNLHNTLQSSMRKAKETSSNILSNAYAKPNNLIEEISQRHEDLTDKLKGLHYDLNDRLTSLHDSLLEKTNLPKLNLFQPNDEVDDFRIKPKYNTPNIQPKDIGRKKLKKVYRNNEDLYSLPKPNLERSKKFRMTPSASVQVPKILKTPKLMKSQNVLTMKPLAREAKPEITQQNKPMSNIHPVHTEAARETFQPTTDINTKHFRSQFSPKSSPNKSLPKISLKYPKLLRDANTAPSENLVSKLHTPPSNTLQKSIPKSLVPERDSPRRTIIAPKPAKLKTVDDLRKAFTLPNLSWPKPTEHSFLSKVKEALRTRLDGTKPMDKVLGKSKTAGDMDRSASTNVKNVDSLSQPIKEKTSYKCKMICTRDSLEVNV